MSYYYNECCKCNCDEYSNSDYYKNSNYNCCEHFSYDCCKYYEFCKCCHEKHLYNNDSTNENDK